MADHRAGPSSAGADVYDWRHYLAVSSASPVPCATARRSRDARCVPPVAGPPAQAPGGDREMVEILPLVLHHDEQAVLCAVELALEAGVPTKTHVLNILHRLTTARRRRHHRSTRRRPCALPRSRSPMSAAMTTCGGAPCVMIPPALPSSSCCAASRCMAWPRPSAI
jgi:hypothetical protein